MRRLLLLMFDDAPVDLANARAGGKADVDELVPAASGPVHRALYLRWRPQSFAGVVGQDHVTRTLRNAIVRGTLAHAYLFTGPRGTGKTSCARILYRAANCENSVDGDPCNGCHLCVASIEGRAMDLVEIDAASNRGIDDIRELRERVAYRPSEGRYRVYIIDEAHELTSAAWDAFLKTLEEPPEHAVFVLATTEAHKIPATIVSRCQRFDFRRIPFDATREQLRRVADAEGLEVEAAVLDRLARVARGGLRDALSLLDQVGAFAGGRIDMQVARGVLGLPSVEVVHATVESLGARDGASVMNQVVDVSEGGADPRQFTEELVVTLRGLLLVRAGSEAALAGEFSSEELAWLREQAAAWSIGSLSVLIGQLSEALARTRDAQQFQVQVELALLGAAAGAGESAKPVPPRAAPTVTRATPVERAPAPPRAPAATSGTPPASALRPVGRSIAEASETPALAAVPPAELSEKAGTGNPAAADATSTSRPADPDPEASFSLIQARWGDVLDRLREARPAKGHLLSTATPRRMDPDGCLVVSMAPGRMNARVARERDTADALIEGIRFVLGQEVRVRCVVGDDDAVQGLLDDPVIQFAARTFGGVPRRVAPPGGGTAVETGSRGEAEPREHLA